MISILIPIYNFDASALFEKLSEELKLIEESIEIIVFDDHSSSFVNENRKTAEKLNFKYSYLSKNAGRSGIRNSLVKTAKHDFVLFLDGDVIPFSKHFIQNYLNHLNDSTEVIYGGRIHEIREEHRSKLRWKYGYYKEDKTVEQRKTRPYLSISTNNVLVKKSIFKQTYFEKSLKTYGHEDTLFAYELKKKQIRALHIDNPVVHMDIDNNAHFIKKTEMALRNLKIISDANLIPSREIKLLRVYESLKSKKIEKPFALFFTQLQKRIKNRLISDKNNLFLFDVYKLGFFCKINRR